MITRDISLEDCILDLIDNSVDGAWRCEGSRPAGLADQADLSRYEIRISATEDAFSISDNCGGMTLDDAINHAFSFGRGALDAHDDFSIGVYGIGMKRAVFKIGGDIKVYSTYQDKTTKRRESFVVPIEVKSWMVDDTPPWDFDLDSAPALPADGVRIEVTTLTEGAAASFASAAFLQNLRRVISRDYALHLNRGLTIRLNDQVIEGWVIELREGDDFAPVRLEYNDDVAGEAVKVELIAGMAAPPPETSDPDDEADGDRRFGWYVVCNGRIVLAADKTGVSGWGSDWPQWHRQYSGFIGIVLFTAANAAVLPLTTTKRSVDLSSEVYRRAKPRMRDASRAWIDYTNSRKQALDAARTVEAAARPVPIYKVALRAAVELPKLVAEQPKEKVANVAYAVPLSRLKRLSREFGAINMPYREVGLESFNYAYKELVGEE